MEKVIVVGQLSDVSLALVQALIQKGMPVYVVTDDVSEWQQVSPELPLRGVVFASKEQITFSPSYTLIVPTAGYTPDAPEQGKVVAVIPHQFKDAVPQMFQQFQYSQSEIVDPTLPNLEKAEAIIRHLFSFGGNVTVFTSINRVEIPKPAVLLPNPKMEAVRENVKPFKKRGVRKKILIIIGIIAGLLLLPFTILGIATALTLVGVKLVTIGELELARSAFAASHSVSSVASSIPGSSQSAYMLQRAALTGERGTIVVEKANEIMKGIFGGERYPLTELSQELQSELNVIHRELSFLESELQKDNSLVARYVPLHEISKVREAVSAGADIAGQLPSLLGVDSQKTYMVLLQNNMELRPTGGFIGSFALLNFSGGRLVDSPVFDVYSADGQLKGHIEPPMPIKEYLGEANWFLRDSNWDPDFPTSANRAEWFLDKTMGIPIDGVVAIDLEFVRQLIAGQGQLSIPDFDLNLTADNFYELLQNEVHNDFFPGSRKKAAVLTATMNALMQNLLNQIENRDVTLATVTSKSLMGRHIQLHIDDPVLQQQVQVLGWAGEAKPQQCTGNCEQIWLGLVEANVGVNKANYFIERNADLKTRWTNGQWEHELAVTFTNTASGEGVEGEHDYETYLRVMAAPDAKFDRVFVQTSKGRKTEIPVVETLKDRVEAGVHALVPAGDTVVITYLWSDKADINLNEVGDLDVSWRKQAGIDRHPVSVSLVLPEHSLTDKHEFEYNSDLEQDLNVHIPIAQ